MRPFEIIEEDDRPWHAAISALQKAGAIPPPILTPEEISFRKEARATISRILEEVLTEREIQVLGLYIMESKSLQETSQILGMGRATVLKMACGALRKLRRPSCARVLYGCVGIS